jgi:hypothetical protein
MTDCMVYRIDYQDLEPWIKEHAELRGALAGLAHFRAKSRAAMLESKPAPPPTGGFINWLSNSVTRWQTTKNKHSSDKIS